MHHKDLQFKHELKKKEREMNRLKDRLHQLLMDKNQDRKIGRYIPNFEFCCPFTHKLEEMLKSDFYMVFNW